MNFQEQRNCAYIIANANGLNTVQEVLDAVDKYYPEYSGCLTTEAITEELRFMSTLVLDGTQLYPNIKL